MQHKNSFRVLNLIIFSIMGFILGTSQSGFSQSGGVFNQLIEASKAEVAHKQGQVIIALEWTSSREGKAVVKEFQEEFPFINAKFESQGSSTYAKHQTWIMQSKSGRSPEFDVMSIGGDAAPDYKKAGLLANPPFPYRDLLRSLPDKWGKADPRSIDPDGMFMATTGLARGNAWNPELVPKGKEPTSWQDCLDPMWRAQFLYDPRPKLTALWYDSKTREMHIKWLKGIIENGAVLNRGQTENLQKVAAGEFPLVCGVNYHSSFKLIDRGAPIKFAFPDPYPLETGTQVYVVKWSKMPATTQLFAIWLATRGQEAVEKYAYRGFPWDPKSRKYPLAKGKYAAVCDAKCITKRQEYAKIHSDILGLPGVR